MWCVVPRGRTSAGAYLTLGERILPMLLRRRAGLPAGLGRRVQPGTLAGGVPHALLRCPALRLQPQKSQFEKHFSS